MLDLAGNENGDPSGDVVRLSIGRGADDDGASPASGEEANYSSLVKHVLESSHSTFKTDFTDRQMKVFAGSVSKKLMDKNMSLSAEVIIISKLFHIYRSICYRCLLSSSTTRTRN